jgi:hypothetical protein
MIAASWILYMCAAALSSLTEIKVWRGRALVRRNTAPESAFWYAMQVARLTVPLSYNFLTFLSPDVYAETAFYTFLGKLINLTPLGSWFDWLFPIFVLVPVCATLFNLYGKAKRLLGFGLIDIVDEDDENEMAYGTGNWREGRDLIARELGSEGGVAARRHVSGAAVESHDPSNGEPALAISGINRTRSPAARTLGTRAPEPTTQPEDEGFFGALGHRVRNTIDTLETPDWLQGMSKPKWMSGGDVERPAAGERSGSSFTRLFGGGNSQEGRVRL